MKRGGRIALAQQIPTTTGQSDPIRPLRIVLRTGASEIGLSVRAGTKAVGSFTASAAGVRSASWVKMVSGGGLEPITLLIGVGSTWPRWRIPEWVLVSLLLTSSDPPASEAHARVLQCLQPATTASFGLTAK